MNYLEIVDFVKKFELTMVNTNGVLYTMDAVRRVIDCNVPGDIIECGVWKGGCSIAMLLAQKHDYGEVKRPVHLFDSFKGLPPATELDGARALKWQKGLDPDRPYYNNCVANKQEIIDILSGFGFKKDEDYFIYEGWFEDILPEIRSDCVYSLIRFDCDWYNSMITCLRELEPNLARNGCMIIDDYYAWDGCARAVHDYLHEINMPYRIKSIPSYNNGVFMIKESHWYD